MLVLTRKAGEAIRIGDNIKIVIRKLKSGKVSIAIGAPRSVRILRDELRKEAA